MVVLQALQLQSLPFEEVAILDGVQGMQLGDFGGAIHREGQGLAAGQRHVKVAAQQAAAQFQMDEGAQVGLCDPQVDVSGLYGQGAAGRLQLQLPLGLQRALSTDARRELQLEGRGPEAVEILQVEFERPEFQRHLGFGYAVGQMKLVFA